MKARPTQSRKGGKGQLPLAGSRDSVPCGVWGNAPTVPRATSISNALNKGAGSEASLPVTLRVRRRASKLLFPQDSVKNQKNAIGSEMLARWRFFAFGDVLSAYEFAFGRRGFASAEATKGHENKRSLRSPFGNLRVRTPILDFWRKFLFWWTFRSYK